MQFSILDLVVESDDFLLTMRDFFLQLVQVVAGLVLEGILVNFRAHQLVLHFSIHLVFLLGQLVPLP